MSAADGSEGLLGLGTGLQDVQALASVPGFLEEAAFRVLCRSLAFHESFLPSAYVDENRRSWGRLCAFCGRGAASLPFPFPSLVDDLAAEWIDPALCVGNAASLRRVGPVVAA